MSSIDERVKRIPEFHSGSIKLPRKHPLRFALLYGAGPRSLERMAEKALADAAPFKDDAPGIRSFLEAVRLEAEIECFENWQSTATTDALTRRRRENAAIAYAAAEAGIITGPAPKGPAQATCASPTGRTTSSEPELQWYSRPGKPEPCCPGIDLWGHRDDCPAKGAAPDHYRDHPYPEDGILRD